MNVKTAWSVLGVTRSTPLSDVEKRYLARVELLNPERLSDQDLLVENERALEELHAAWETVRKHVESGYKGDTNGDLLSWVYLFGAVMLFGLTMKAVHWTVRTITDSPSGVEYPTRVMVALTITGIALAGMLAWLWVTRLPPILKIVTYIGLLIIAILIVPWR